MKVPNFASLGVLTPVFKACLPSFNKFFSISFIPQASEPLPFLRPFLSQKSLKTSLTSC